MHVECEDFCDKSSISMLGLVQAQSALIYTERARFLLSNNRRLSRIEPQLVCEGLQDAQQLPNHSLGKCRWKNTSLGVKAVQVNSESTVGVP